MYTLITVLIIITCLLLALIVLVQNSKGGGLASGLGSSNQIMGVRKTTDMLEKLTWGFGVALMVFCLFGTMMMPKGGENQEDSKLLEQVSNTAIPTAPAPAPQAPAANTPPPAANTPPATNQSGQ
ncbi:MAG: preprotein translocase subunit SecG [Bacteroidia bacterium]